jgi:acyl-CoA synthetase (NDP forming)
MTAAAAPFDRLFAPRAVAIVGASRDPSALSGQPLRYLTRFGFPGAIYPVNPSHDSVAGLPCYPDVGALPEAPDVAYVAVAAHRVPDVLDQCGARGIPYALVVTSGFAELGAEGAALQAEVAAVSRRRGIRVLGPNCQGVIDVAGGFRVGFGSPYDVPYRAGPISLVSQSGASGNSVLMLADEQGLGFRRYAATGNEADVTSLDLIDALVDDPGPRGIAADGEGWRDARRAVAVGRRAAAADTPVIAWKVGRSAAGARAAASHTANLAGSAAIYSAAFRQAGMIEVSDVDELIDCARGLLGGVRPAGNRAGFVTLSGGAGIAMADRCAERGLAVPPLAAASLAALTGVLPALAVAQNPLDLTAGINRDIHRFADTLRAFVADPGIDMIGIAMAAFGGGLAEESAEAIREVAAASPKPLFVAWNARAVDVGAAYDTLDAAGIPRFPKPGRCVRGMAAAAAFARARRRLTGTTADPSHPTKEGNP